MRMARGFLLLLFSSVVLMVWWGADSHSGVRTTLIPDNTMTTMVSPPQITPQGNRYIITGGMRPGNSRNLFHSFDRFSIGTGDTARFAGPVGIEHIISRVTGGQPSEIYGRLQSTIPGAALYLLNPSGVVFGPEAQLDVRGSFYVSTADRLHFADGTTLTTRLEKQGTLTVASPAAFGFLRHAPADIVIKRSQSLVVPDGHTLAIIGGDLAIKDGSLQASGGQISLVSLASPGTVALPTPGDTSHGALTGAGGTITLSHTTLLEASGTKARGTTGGTVYIRSGRLHVQNTEIFADNWGSHQGPARGVDIAVSGTVRIRGGFVTADTFSTGEASDLHLVAERVHLQKEAFLGSRTERAATGQAGDIVVRARAMVLQGGARIASQTRGRGLGGTVTVTVDETLTLQGTDRKDFPSGLVADTQRKREGAGAAGTVTVKARNIVLRGGAQISAASVRRGHGGVVTITATEMLRAQGIHQTEGDFIASGVNANSQWRQEGAGDAGKITVTAPIIVLRNGAQIASLTFGPGRGGMVSVRATATLKVQGMQHTIPAGVFADTYGSMSGAGAAGIVTVQARNVVLDEGGQIASGTFGRGSGGKVIITAAETFRARGRRQTPTGPSSSGVFADTAWRQDGAGDAGSVQVKAENVFLSQGAQMHSSTFGPGRGGAVSIQANEALQVSGPFSGVFANARSNKAGAGDAGSVQVQARDIILVNRAQVGSGTFGPGQGGHVTVFATDTIAIEGTNPAETRPSGVFASTLGSMADAGDAGTVTVQAQHVILRDGGRISSRTAGAGQGGHVTVTATETLTLRGQQTSFRATTEGSGQGGDLTIKAPTVSLLEGATISAASAGPGDAGTIRLTATDRLFLQRDSAVTTASTGIGNGGNIVITAQTMVRLQDSQITTEVGSGQGAGGNISIDPTFVILQNSRITADAFGGPGGNITITAGVFLADPNSQVTASSEQSIDGIVNIQAPVANLSGLVAPLTPGFPATVELLRNRCAARLYEGTVSSLVARGRDGVPRPPEAILPGRLYLSSPTAAEVPGHKPNAQVLLAPSQVARTLAPLRLELVCRRY